jgi:phage shock protein A
VLDEVGRRIDERYAKAQGMLEVSGRSTEAQLAQVRLNATQLAVTNTYEEYQRQLGLAPDTETPRQLEPGVTTDEQTETPRTIQQEQ